MFKLLIPKFVWRHINSNFDGSSNNEYRRRRMLKSSYLSHITKGYISHKFSMGTNLDSFLSNVYSKYWLLKAGMRFSKDQVGVALNDGALGMKKTICVVDVDYHKMPADSKMCSVFIWIWIWADLGNFDEALLSQLLSLHYKHL